MELLQRLKTLVFLNIYQFFFDVLYIPKNPVRQILKLGRLLCLLTQEAAFEMFFYGIYTVVNIVNFNL
jgi:hypothetical protein